MFEIEDWVMSRWYYGRIERFERRIRMGKEDDEAYGCWIPLDNAPVAGERPVRGHQRLSSLIRLVPTEEQEARWCEAQITR
jgi:hypothetical protein